MNNTQMQMDQYTHNAFWREDRITVTFQLGPDATPIPPPEEIPGSHSVTKNEMAEREGPPPTFDKTSAIKALNLRGLNDFLDKSDYPMLNTIDFTDTMRTPGAIPPADPEQIGKYLFTSINDQGQYVPTVVCFFKFDSMTMKSSPTGSSTAATSMSGNGNESSDPVVRLVNFINRQDTLEYLRNRLKVPIISASPHWLTGGSPYAPVGCPLSPPIPVPGHAHCSSSPGLWPIMLPELSSDLERMTGDGVHVIILDTLPREEDIKRALEGAEDHNLLLLDVVNNVVRRHNLLPVDIDEPNPKQPKTGKDVKGRNGGGFRMADHGLFIAGIVRDVAPYAKVECIRALNDFCAGESSAFVKALESIENRMLPINPDDNNKPGDLYQKQVVINLSCVVPPDTYLQMLGIILGDVRADLIKPIRALADLGALFAASAGNEGDTRYQPANPTHIRPDALYPAQFAYYGVGKIKALGNSMIPVGAVEKHGNPTSYSCYPGVLGIATYGGDVPKHFKQDESGCFTEAEDLDALTGIYTSLSYPALLLEDCRPTYPVPNSHAWAYWSGTSFATPIITGLVARMMQYKLENPSALIPPDVNINQALTNLGVTTHQITWDRLDPGFHSEPGQMLLAVQKCESNDHDDHDDKRERVDIHVTINERE
jgi:hypothetical protein